MSIYQEAIRKKYFWSTHNITYLRSSPWPNLFLLYISDLQINIQMAETVLFVDDADILIQAAKEDILNHKINRFPTEFLIWFDGNGLIINFKRNTAVSFHNWQNRSFLKLQIIINYLNINYKHESKYLDLCMTKYETIKNLISELNESYYVMQSLTGIIRSNILRRTYFATFYPHFRNGILFGRR